MSILGYSEKALTLLPMVKHADSGATIAKRCLIEVFHSLF